MPLELFVALRYLKAKRNGVFALMTTMIAIGGITLGVAALIITLAVMSGFHRDIREKILGIQPHIVVTKEGPRGFADHEDVAKRIRALPAIKAVAPFVYGQIILRNHAATTGAVVKAVDLAAEDATVGLRSRLVGGASLQRLTDTDIILGQELATALGARTGDELVVMTPSQQALIPRMQKFRVAGIFHSGMYEYDATLSFISLAAGQNLFGLPGAVTGLGVALDHWEHAAAVEQDLQRTLAYPYWVRSWERMNYNLFAALKLEKIMMFIILGLIVLVAAFTIISNLLLFTMEKARDIGILSAIGFRAASIARIFFYEGVIIGCAGIAMGTALGTGISLLLKRYQFIHLPADVYYLDTLPVRLAAGDVASVVSIALIITIAASVYPAYQVTKLNPLDAIRYG